jgi:Domain of unknown function (DUF1744)
MTTLPEHCIRACPPPSLFAATTPRAPRAGTSSSPTRCAVAFTPGLHAAPASALHAPALLAAAAAAASKAFLQLLASLKALDAILVAASPPGTIVLATRKADPAAAGAYIRFLADTLATRPLFRWISLEPTRVWRTLLWRDAFNFSGLRAPLSALRLDGLVATVGTRAPEATDHAIEYEASWNVRDFLPPATHKYFDDVVRRYVERLWQAAMLGDDDGTAAGGAEVQYPLNQASLGSEVCMGSEFMSGRTSLAVHNKTWSFGLK